MKKLKRGRPKGKRYETMFSARCTAEEKTKLQRFLAVLRGEKISFDKIKEKE